jgi:hypothetical protein
MNRIDDLVKSELNAIREYVHNNLSSENTIVAEFARAIKAREERCQSEAEFELSAPLRSGDLNPLPASLPP